MPQAQPPTVAVYPQRIESRVVTEQVTARIYHVGNPGPRGPVGGGSLEEIFSEDDWAPDPENEGLARLVLAINTHCLDVWQIVGSVQNRMTDVLLISVEEIDGGPKLTIRNGLGAEFSGFVAYVPRGINS